MLLEAGTIPSDEVLECDICIVGGGIAGLTIARELAGTSVRVCLLESGGIEHDPPKADLSRGENGGRPYDQLEEGRYRRLGGASHLWNIDLGEGEFGPRLHALDPIDFEVRDWVPYSGWPFGRAKLEPYYEHAHLLLGLGEPTEDPAFWSGISGHEALDFPAGRVRSTVFHFLRRDLYTREFPRQVAAAANIRVVVDATVTELELLPGSPRLARARVATTAGNRFSVKAKTFVLATGGTENARLLLASRRHRPAGLGNEHDLVGRFFMEHLHFRAGWIVPRERGLLARAGFYGVHRANGVPVMGKLTLSQETQRRERLLNWCTALRPRWEPVDGTGVRALVTLRGNRELGYRRLDRRAALENIARDPATVLRYGLERARRRLGGPERPNVFRLSAMTEQAPDPASRVTLSDERDRLGQRRVHLDWRLGGIDLDSIARASRILDEELRAAGLGRLESALDADGEPPRIVGGWHHMGTTRMHRDPRCGVVDEDMRVHGLANLYVAGSSVFPTGGYANPTLTIVALALRLAEHLREEASGRVSSAVEEPGPTTEAGASREGAIGAHPGD